MRWTALIVLVAAGVLLSLLAAAGLRERVARAAILAGLLLAADAALAALLLLGPHGPLAHAATGAVTVAGAGLLLVAAIRRTPRVPPPDSSQARRFDERDHMFSRANLQYHPALARRHHDRRPEHRAVDEQIFGLPPLAGAGSRYHDPDLAPAADAAFELLDRIWPALARLEPVETDVPPDPSRVFEGVRFLARANGAVDVGVVRTRPLHWYSHAGRQAGNWGEPIEPRHRTAIVLVVPMRWSAIRHAPSLPVILESSRAYLQCAVVAHLITRYLALRGVEARAHVDAHYEVVCAPLAQEAGLGHVGRMGIFMHRRLGPSVRLAVVTTNLELPVTSGDHSYMERFCTICRKCARSCPSRAIPAEGRPTSRGFPHWSIDQESCYTFWRRIGTDCAVCIRSCPFAKPDTAIHRLLRWFVARNALAQRLALWGDDLFYGRRLRLPPVNPPFAALVGRR